MEGIALILVYATLATLAWYAKKVGGYDASDCELITKVDGLGKRADRFESYVMNKLADIKADLKELLRRSDLVRASS